MDQPLATSKAQQCQSPTGQEHLAKRKSTQRLPEYPAHIAVRKADQFGSHGTPWVTESEMRGVLGCAQTLWIVVNHNFN